MDGWNLTFVKSWVSWSRLNCRFQSLQYSCAHVYMHTGAGLAHPYTGTCVCGGCARITLGSVSHRKSPALLWPRPQLHLPPRSLSPCAPEVCRTLPPSAHLSPSALAPPPVLEPLAMSLSFLPSSSYRSGLNSGSFPLQSTLSVP